MQRSIQDEILQVEDQLRAAMLSSDINILDALLAPELIFTNHLGLLLCKDDDLAAHRSGVLKISSLAPSEQYVRVLGNVAVVSVRMKLVGTYDGASANGDFRFTRVWARSSKEIWQIVAAHSGLVTQ